MLGGRQVPSNTRDFHERRLLNVVEEMALASGVPVPAVFVLDGEHVARRDIQADAPDRGTARVTSGLQGGETVVLDPTSSLRDGQAVTGDNDDARGVAHADRCVRRLRRLHLTADLCTTAG